MKSNNFIGLFHTRRQTFIIPKCIYPGCLWVFCHHEHEVDIDQVCAAADADDAAL